MLDFVAVSPILPIDLSPDAPDAEIARAFGLANLPPGPWLDDALRECRADLFTFYMVAPRASAADLEGAE